MNQDNPNNDPVIGKHAFINSSKWCSNSSLREWELACEYDGQPFTIRIFGEIAAKLKQCGLELEVGKDQDFSKAPYLFVVGHDSKHNRRCIEAFHGKDGLKKIAELPRRVIESAVPVMVNGKLVSPADLPTPSPVIAPVSVAPAIAPSPELSLEARLARMLQDAEAIYSAMPSAMTAQLLFNARYLNGIKPQSEKAQVEAHLLAKIGVVNASTPKTNSEAA